MSIQVLKMAWSAIASNKMRSFLTMLGIIIGVIAVVVLVSLVTGASDSITGEIQALGTNLLSVRVLDDNGHPVTLSDLKRFGKENEIGLIAPSLSFGATVKHRSETYEADAVGTTGQYDDIRGIKVKHGRFLKAADINNNSSVVVIGHEIAEELYGKSETVGETLSIGGRSFLIVGVLEESGSMISNDDQTVYLPYTVASRMVKRPNITAFVASPATDDIDSAEEKLNQLLMRQFRQDEDSFILINQSALMDTMNSVTGTLKLLLGGIAAISLMVGGIGIMNIMLVSVTERTREIGIRKAIGATRGNILMQFLVEALMVSLIGGVIGLMISWGILEVISSVAGEKVSFSMSPQVIGLALGFSLMIGVAFGLYPANKASKLHPVEALRYE
ncbi:MAG: Macrolide export ATP-binding/permease protein MacB [Firmicutes bacterium ADurb.Bin182]|nr:MAG: Macrolide export ATP-binding/permease protein MacB [Firmicutes bacterium ADurb.Bin182]